MTTPATQAQAAAADQAKAQAVAASQQQLANDMQTIAVGQATLSPLVGGSSTDLVGAVANAGLTGLCDIFGP